MRAQAMQHRREVGIARQDDELVEVGVVREVVAHVHHHADVGGVLELGGERRAVDHLEAGAQEVVAHEREGVHVGRVVMRVTARHRVAVAAVHDDAAVIAAELRVGRGDQAAALDLVQPRAGVLGETLGRLLALALERQVDVVVVDENRAEARPTRFPLHMELPPTCRSVVCMTCKIVRLTISRRPQIRTSRVGAASAGWRRCRNKRNKPNRARYLMPDFAVGNAWISSGVARVSRARPAFCSLDVQCMVVSKGTAAPRIASRFGPSMTRDQSPAGPSRSPRTQSRAQRYSRPASRRRGCAPAARPAPAPLLAGARRQLDHIRASLHDVLHHRRWTSTSGAPAYQCQTSAASTRASATPRPRAAGSRWRWRQPALRRRSRRETSRENARPRDAAPGRAGAMISSAQVCTCDQSYRVSRYPAMHARADGCLRPRDARPGSAAVLALADLAEDLPIGLADHAQALLDGRHMRAQEGLVSSSRSMRVGSVACRQRAGHRPPWRASAAPRCRARWSARSWCWPAYTRARNRPRSPSAAPSASERVPHHLGVALDDAAAADRKQRVADEGHAG